MEKLGLMFENFICHAAVKDLAQSSHLTLSIIQEYYLVIICKFKVIVNREISITLFSTPVSSKLPFAKPFSPENGYFL